MVLTLILCFCEGDDHRIMIYYPSSAGGGMKELFRKVSDFLTALCLLYMDSKHSKSLLLLFLVLYI